MNIAIISGSHRQGSQTKRVCDYLSIILNQKSIDTTTIDLHADPLPFIESDEAKSEAGVAAISDFKSKLTMADGIIVATPEWAGGATAGIMNALSIAGKTVAHKPALIVTVSNGRGGGYPVTEIRSYGYKNNKIVFVPDHIIVHYVNDVLHDNSVEEQSDLYIRERIDWSLDNLLLYTKHLKDLRNENSAQLLDDRFGNGMS